MTVFEGYIPLKIRAERSKTAIRSHFFIFSKSIVSTVMSSLLYNWTTMILPNFSLPDQSGVVHTPQEYLGRWVVLYSYPKDNTPGCTAEACQFRDLGSEFSEKGIVILGISADSVESHQKFAAQHHLQFPLLADEDHAVLEALEAWAPKKMFGKEFFGVQRNTYLINPKGEIVKVYKKVNPLTSPAVVLKDIDTFKKSV